MKLHAIYAPTGREELEEDNMAKAVMQAAQKKVVSQVSGQQGSGGTVSSW